MEYLINLGKNAKEAASFLNTITTNQKNEMLLKAAEEIKKQTAFILSENKKDVENAITNGIKGAFVDRLTLNEERIAGIVEGLLQVASLDDPTKETILTKTLPNGLLVSQRRVAMGVIGIIYEARPNVTADAFGLCFKAGSATILRGGKEAINTNMAIVNAFQKALVENNMPKSIVQLIEDTSRETAHSFMKLNKYVDVLIPRGSGSLIQSVIENSTIPVIETGIGNCHIFVDESADFEMAINIIINAKTQRPGVCNACEKVLVHKNISDKFMPKLIKALKDRGVKIVAEESLKVYCEDITISTEQDWFTEFVDLIIGIKVVENIDEAIGHIEKYSSGHSEAIITENYTNSNKFLDMVNSACVYVNASTRFTDGFEFGLGAEIGISTQKLHARGPMGLRELTSTKFVIYGSGQVRK